QWPSSSPRPRPCLRPRSCSPASSRQRQRTSVASPCRPSLRKVTFTSIIAHGRAGAQGYFWIRPDRRCSLSAIILRLLARHFFPTLWRRCRRLDVVVLQPFAHRLPHALVVEPEPSLALRRVLRQHVLEPSERAVAVERDLQAIAQARVGHRRGELRHPAVLHRRLEWLDAHEGAFRESRGRLVLGELEILRVVLECAW